MRPTLTRPVCSFHCAIVSPKGIHLRIAVISTDPERVEGESKGERRDPRILPRARKKAPPFRQGLLCVTCLRFTS
jgi:hypothetical protein